MFAAFIMIRNDKGIFLESANLTIVICLVIRYIRAYGTTEEIDWYRLYYNNFLSY